MTSSTSSATELRVLHGSQSGARLVVLAGMDYVLGASSECEVILAGPHLAQRHAKVSLTDDGVRTTLLDGAVNDAKGRPISDSNVISLGAPLQLGGIWIAFDKVDAPWPDEQALQALIHRQPEEEIAIQTEDVLDQPSQDGMPPPIATAQPAPRHAHRTAIHRAFTVALLLALSGGGTAAWVYAEQSDGDGSDQAVALLANTNTSLLMPLPAAIGKPLAMPAAIDQAIRKLGWQEALTAMPAKNGVWTVTGYLRTDADVQSLTVALDGVYPQTALHVLSEEGLVAASKEAMQAALASGRHSLRVDSAVRGKVRLSGAAENADMVSTAAQAIKANVPGVDSVETHVLLPEQLVEKLKERLTAAGLLDRLRFGGSGTGVVLTGDLTNSETTAWENLIIQFGREYGNVLPFRARIGEQQSRTVALDVQTIVGGTVPYVVTQGGERVNQGGTIRGRTLVAIRDGDVIFDGNQHLTTTR